MEIKLRLIGDEHAAKAADSGMMSHRGAMMMMHPMGGMIRDHRGMASARGVQFFPMSSLEPRVYTVLQVLGFVEELLVDNDPEFDLMDRARSARSSNEMRLSLLYRQGAKVRMMLGEKVDNLLGGNAVLGYRQHFDVEGDSGIVARA